jgi:proteasome lid subunit RPN8/RPN11
MDSNPRISIGSLRIAFRRFARAAPGGHSRERGGLVLANENRLDFQELPNRSPSDRRYIAVVPAMDRLPGQLIGFWHTHPGSAVPSPTDLREMWTINRRFQRAFPLCVVGRRACSITIVSPLQFPYFRYDSLDSSRGLDPNRCGIQVPEPGAEEDELGGVV